MMESNHRNHARYMVTVFELYDPDSFVETVLWVFRTYRAHGFHVAYWAAMLDMILDIMREELSPETYEATSPFYEWILTRIPVFTLLSETESPALETPGQPPSHD